MDRRESTKKALSAYLAKHEKSLKPKRKNKSPEKDVERECVIWMKEQGWDVQIVSAKAQYNPKAGRWISQAISAGTVDCIGVMPTGVFVAVEFKSKGALGQFNRPHNIRQRQYIKDKIASNAFACVVDSVKLLQSIYEAWIGLEDASVRKTFLSSKLP